MAAGKFPKTNCINAVEVKFSTDGIPLILFLVVVPTSIGGTEWKYLDLYSQNTRSRALPSSVWVIIISF